MLFPFLANESRRMLGGLENLHRVRIRYGSYSFECRALEEGLVIDNDGVGVVPEDELRLHDDVEMFTIT